MKRQLSSLIRGRFAFAAGIALTVCTLFVSGSSFADSLSVSARDFPVAYDVDVLVVGGTSAGVAAAVEAAKAGQKVFLMAQRPYLGEDLCGTYRLWADPSARNASELVRSVFEPPVFLEQIGLDYEYQSNIPSQKPHQDKNSMLSDGKRHDLQRQTVQYGEDVEITITLPEEQRVDQVDVSAFQSPGSFATRSVTVFISDNQTDWKKVGEDSVEKLAKGAKTFSIPVEKKTRYLKVSATLADKVKRMLISEIDVLSKAERRLERGDVYPPTPLHVKRTLDNALLDAGVDFLFGCYPTDLLVDPSGAAKGVVMANRAGRQIVRAKVIIDATPTAMLPRMAGLAFRSAVGPHVFEHVVVSDTLKKISGVKAQGTPTLIYHQGKHYPAQVYRMPVKMGELTMHSYAEAQQRVLDKLWTAGQLSASEHIFTVPDSSIVSAQPFDGSLDALPVEATRPVGLSGVYVLSGCADISRDCADDFLAPGNSMLVGERLGQQVASFAAAMPPSGSLAILAPDAGTTVAGELAETLAPLRPEMPVEQRITLNGTSYPVLGNYNVVVVGGGTSGGPAVIGSARQGAKTLVIEYQHGFGGVGTLGLIGRYWKGFREGFTKELDAGVAALRLPDAPRINGWDVNDKMEWYRREMREAGAEMWMRSMAWGAVVTDGDVKGVAVSTPFGTGIVLADVVIDSTGNGDIAIAAGADYEYYGTSRISIQGTGMPIFNLGESYNNSDFTVTYESDVVDNWHLRVYAKGQSRAGDFYDVSSLVDSRERRRVMGDFYLTLMDQLMERTYPDTIYRGYSDYDCHGVNYNNYIFLQPNPHAFSCSVPYRCLLPKGLDGILTTGMGISIHSDALPIIRMQPDLQNQGYATGMAAAMAAEAGVEPRDVDIKALQRKLVENGCLPAEVLTATDDYPLSKERIQQAVENAPAEYGSHEGTEISLVLGHREVALPMLRAAYENAVDKKKRFYAHILAVLEDPAGMDTLIEYVDSHHWDKGHPRPTARMSSMDRIVIALGLSGDSRATDQIIKKMARMNEAFDYSHFRAVSIALDLLRDPAAAPSIAGLLQKRGMRGYAVHSIEDAVKEDDAALKKLEPNAGTKFSFETREFSMRELALARALYRCGDHEGLGKEILEDYSTDLRGILAAHAMSVLNEK